MATLTIPLFPLHSVVFPGGPLSLRIFEPRYLDMVSRCLRQEGGFGICLIRDGHEVGAAAEVHEVGTFGHIRYWHRRPDGLLGITFGGEQRFRILEQWEGDDRLLTATVALLPNAAPTALPARYQGLAALLERILGELGHPYITLERRLDDAEWVSARLAELLPLEHRQKQQLLLMDEPLERLRRIEALLGR